jgi:hypothetical protein
MDINALKVPKTSRNALSLAVTDDIDTTNSIMDQSVQQLKVEL